MQAITTKYLGPTDTRDSRIIVRSASGRMTVAWAHELDIEDNHARAAWLYIRKRIDDGDWRDDDAPWIAGSLPDGTRCYVCLRRTEDESIDRRIRDLQARGLIEADGKRTHR